MGKPLEVKPGFCFVNTSYEQDGKELDWDDTTRKLSRYEGSSSHVSAGNSWAIGSIVAVVVATPALILGSSGRQERFDMDKGAATALLVGGTAVSLGGLVMCVVSDSEYAAAGHAYNERLGTSGQGPSDERAYETPEFVK